MSHVQHRNGALDVVDDLENLFDCSPQFLLSTRLDAYEGRLRLMHPREGGVVFLFLLNSPDGADAVDHTSHDVGDLFVGFGPRLVIAVGADVANHVSSVDDFTNLHRRFHL